ncbi:hypothetical protein [Dermatobacter hominis]|uniref:hypothetical protein n=1 Tax=Dermatobacter hominis TaxID=2884263 RepID=UPI001D11C233|nr:hypothetical protein [Dermatobacter hominis]UDY34169.1 hypothetical protein LH044_12530 [Dermatobacter hominis]
MGEGLSASEVGKEIAEHSKHHGVHDGEHRAVSIIEAILLAVVALLAAWSGYAAAKWSTDSRLSLAEASAARTRSSQADLRAMESRNFDSTTFNAWFTAWIADDQQAMTVAERRFRPEFEVAFTAWMATDPANNPDAPAGPTYMPEYEQPAVEESKELSATADEKFEEGSENGGTADDYVRITVLLASVLFIVGISSQFRLRSARVGLITVGVVVLVYCVVLLAGAPKPPF